MWRPRLIEPKLQTAVSLPEVTSRISVHKLDKCTVRPGSAVWLHARFDLSLNVIQPLPVWANVRIMRAYRSPALTVLAAKPARSAASYARSNSAPYRSGSSGTTFGSNRLKSASASTRRMNKSLTQLARFKLCVRLASSPVLSRSSRNASMSACQVSRYTAQAPLRLPPWFTADTDASSVFNHGTMPFDLPLVLSISDPRERTRWY